MTLRFSTGCCNKYQFPGSSWTIWLPNIPNLGGSVEAGDHVKYWYTQAGLSLYRAWTDEDLFPEDFKDEAACIDGHPRCDLNPAGGSDVPEIYYFQGHGEELQIALTRGLVHFDEGSVWGNDPGRLQFLFLMCCATINLSAMGKWQPLFRGLHMVVGNTDLVSDSLQHGVNFVAWTSGVLNFAPGLSVGDAWMRTGLIDAVKGCSAVAVAAGDTQADAEDRCAHERIKDNRPKPSSRWLAWRWVTKPGGVSTPLAVP